MFDSIRSFCRYWFQVEVIPLSRRIITRSPYTTATCASHSHSHANPGYHNLSQPEFELPIPELQNVHLCTNQASAILSPHAPSVTTFSPRTHTEPYNNPAAPTTAPPNTAATTTPFLTAFPFAAFCVYCTTLAVVVFDADALVTVTLVTVVAALEFEGVGIVDVVAAVADELVDAESEELVLEVNDELELVPDMGLEVAEAEDEDEDEDEEFELPSAPRPTTAVFVAVAFDVAVEVEMAVAVVLVVVVPAPSAATSLK